MRLNKMSLPSVLILPVLTEEILEALGLNSPD